ncbi:nucleoside/nucleotide kinase family protein [Thalassiella azotivora]
MRTEALVARAVALCGERPRTLLGVCGEPGSGKSTLAEQIVRRADELTGEPGFAVLVPMDGFHLADAELRRLGLLGRKGAPSTFDAAGYVALLRRLADPVDDVVYAPGFERTLEQPLAGALPVPRSTRLVVTEGSYLLLDEPAWRPVAALLAEVWCCVLPAAERRERLVGRHVRFGRTPQEARRWVDDVDEPNAALVRATLDRCHHVVDGTTL